MQISFSGFVGERGSTRRLLRLEVEHWKRKVGGIYQGLWRVQFRLSPA